MKRCFMVGMLTLCLTAEARVVTAEYEVQSGNGEETISVATDALEYPDAVVLPVFWLDARSCDGWVIDGTDIITIPSRVGTRSLTLNYEGGDWGGWGGSQDIKPLSPSYAYDADLKASVVDFGEIGSRKGLVFSAENGSNEMTGIGTVIAVYGSQQGGGFFMGGGYGARGGYGWHRGTGVALATGAFEYDAPLFAGAAYDCLTAAAVRHDGLLTAGKSVGMSGGWEIVSVMPSAAAAQATGIGLGDTRNWNYEVRSGGMKIAELLIYNKTLAVSDVEKVEAYLRSKWFGEAVRGHRGGTEIGRMRIYDGTVETVSVPDGETLSIGELRGRDTETLVKSGGGTLRLGNAENFGGTVELSGGTLDFSGKAIPAASELPRGLYLRFDASDEDTITVAERDGVNYVIGWSSLAGGTYNGQRIGLAASTDVGCPVLEKDALGPGLNALDFGETAEAGAGGGLLAFDMGGSPITLPNIHTIIAVMNVKHGGGYILGASEYWRAGGGKEFADGFIDPGRVLSSSPLITAEDVHIWLDGIRAPPSANSGRSGFRHPGWHIFAGQTGTGCSAKFFGARYDGYSGGAKYAEVLIWNRTLSDDEILWATSYLSAKWFGRRTPGFAAPAKPERPDLQKVRVSSSAAISVGGCDVVRVGALELGAPMAKRGSGTLEIGRMDAVASLAVESGRVDFAGPEAPVADAAIAPGSAMHLDASLSASLHLVETDRKYVKSWTDASGLGGVRQKAEPYRPWLNETDLCNGLPTVDFGTFGERSASGGRYLDFCRSLDNVRHAFIVWGAHEGGGFLLGTSTDTAVGDEGNSGIIDLCRQENAGGLVLDNVNTEAVRNGRIFIDGVVFPWNGTPEAKYQLLEYHPASGVRVSGLCLDRYISVRYGGARIGEAIFYERELNEAEIVATRNYLSAKWFGRSAEPVPIVTSPTNVVGMMTVASNIVISVDAPLQVQELVGAGQFTKIGSAMLSVDDISSFSGKVTVVNGTLRLSMRATSDTGSLVADGRILHVDASAGLVCETNQSGVVYVREWKSVLGDGWTCVAHGVNGVYPTLMSAESGNRPGFAGAARNMPAVDMLDGAANAQYFTFTKNGTQTELDGIRTVFWVIGSQRGGGWMMGGGTINGSTHHAYLWHRGGDGTGQNAADPLLNGTYGDSVGLGVWRKNGISINPKTEGLSGGWDILSLVTHGDEPASADGFAFDGRVLDGMSAVAVRDGSQRLGEVIVYNRKLTSAEVVATEKYLAQKWGMAQGVSSAIVELSDETFLDCGGVEQHFGTLAGTGFVTNGVLSVDRIICNPSFGGAPKVEAFAVPERLIVDFGDSMLSETELVKGVEVLRAGAFTGLENLRKAVFVGTSIPREGSMTLVARKGRLVAKARMAFSLLIR